MNPTGQRQGYNCLIGELLLLGWRLWIKHGHQKITMTHTQTKCPNRITIRAGKKGARPAEVGALAPAFKKSETELKQKQKNNLDVKAQYK